ncbi:MAG: hypothetical protein EOM64_01270 [Erysipelotrichia bacterium]|nr:hypothetical protein [Erysipelotrichia bacterium]
MKLFKRLLCIMLALSLWACRENTAHAAAKKIDSQLYSAEEIDSAIDTISEEFNREWKGCTLTELYYAGDEISEEYQDWADRNHADEVIVLMSSFEVDSSGGDGSLNPDSTYDGWKFILTRTNGGSWIHVDHGY